tara:strand:- start:465 stop:1253 length:789 start_codon:yes stop_codon:yes gene_type:complete
MNYLNSKIIGSGSLNVIILHGFLGMSDNWLTIGKKISGFGFKVHLVDLRNHGKSFWSDQFNYKVMSDDLKLYIDKNKILDFYLIGHSMGGKSAIQFAYNHPSKVKKLIVLDIINKNYDSNYLHIKILNLLESIDFSSYKRRIEIENYLFENLNDKILVRFLMKNIYRDSYDKFKLKPNVKVLKKNYKNICYKINLNENFNIETIFFRGEKSNYIDNDDVKEKFQKFNNYRIIDVPDAGHWIHIDNSNFFLEKLIPEITKLYL